MKNKDVTDAAAIGAALGALYRSPLSRQRAPIAEGHVRDAREVADFLRKNVVQGRRNEEGNYGAKPAISLALSRS